MEDPRAEKAAHGEREARPDGAGAKEPAAAAGEPMSMLDHLEELRHVLLHSLIVAFLASIAGWFFSRPLLDLLVAPIRKAAEGVYFHTPVEAFLIRVKLSFVAGAFVVLPYILFKVYGFILPGLYTRERKVVTPLLISSTGLFYLGVVFAYTVVIPQVVKFLLSFGTQFMQPLIGIGPYFAFVSRLCLAFGLIFELPLVVLFLSLLGLVDPHVLLRTWRYAIVLIVTMSAVLTPPDVLSQLMMAVPVVLLYIVSVLVAIVVTRRRRAGKGPAADRTRTEPDDTAGGEG
jgi:sec-independent protein translocase protein TatC